VLPALERLAGEPDMPNLAISLHATTNEDRNRLVPINRRYDLEELIEVCQGFPVPKRRRITFEYVMLAGVNDSLEDARRLVRLLSGIKAKVNSAQRGRRHSIHIRLTTASTHCEGAITAPREYRSARVVWRDIRAACGQLTS
jgi:23S rRNA (adenine2503-C2)-methyltransferase